MKTPPLLSALIAVGAISFLGETARSGEAPALPVKEFHLNATASQELLRQSSRDTKNADRVDARAYLESRGIIFQPGATASFAEPNHLLTVANARAQLELLEVMFP